MNQAVDTALTEPALEKPGRVRAFWNWLTRAGGPRGTQPISAAELKLARAIFSDILAGIGGEASARQRVATLASLYRGLNDDGATVERGRNVMHRAAVQLQSLRQRACVGAEAGESGQ